MNQPFSTASVNSESVFNSDVFSKSSNFRLHFPIFSLTDFVWSLTKFFGLRLFIFYQKNIYTFLLSGINHNITQSILEFVEIVNERCEKKLIVDHSVINSITRNWISDIVAHSKNPDCIKPFIYTHVALLILRIIEEKPIQEVENSDDLNFNVLFAISLSFAIIDIPTDSTSPHTISFYSYLCHEDPFPMGVARLLKTYNLFNRKSLDGK